MTASLWSAVLLRERLHAGLRAAERLLAHRLDGLEEILVLPLGAGERILHDEPADEPAERLGHVARHFEAFDPVEVAAAERVEHRDAEAVEIGLRKDRLARQLF